jgi:hypothetical protein
MSDGPTEMPKIAGYIIMYDFGDNEKCVITRQDRSNRVFLGPIENAIRWKSSELAQKALDKMALSWPRSTKYLRVKPFY